LPGKDNQQCQRKRTERCGTLTTLHLNSPKLFVKDAITLILPKQLPLPGWNASVGKALPELVRKPVADAIRLSVEIRGAAAVRHFMENGADAVSTSLALIAVPHLRSSQAAPVSDQPGRSRRHYE
jgi:hypothetical protein